MPRVGINCPRGSTLTPTTIDFSLFSCEYPRPFSMNSRQREELSRLRHALHTNGCIAITNHGIEEYQQRLLEATDQMMALPETEKKRLQAECADSGGLSPYTRRVESVAIVEKCMELMNTIGSDLTPAEAEKAAHQHFNTIKEFKQEVMAEDIEKFSFPTTMPADLSATFHKKKQSHWGPAAKNGDIVAEDALEYIQFNMINRTDDDLALPDPSLAPAVRPAITAYMRKLQYVSAVFFRIMETMCDAKPGQLSELYFPTELGCSPEFPSGQFRCLQYTYGDEDEEQEEEESGEGEGTEEKKKEQTSGNMVEKKTNGKKNLRRGIAGHTDKGLFTINWCPDDVYENQDGLDGLEEESMGGLEVLSEGRWHAVVRRGYYDLVVNLADLLTWMSDGEWESTVHRVSSNVPPPASSSVHVRPSPSQWYRRAFPLFIFPAVDCLIEPIPSLNWAGREEGDIKQKQDKQPTFGAAHYSRWLDEFTNMFLMEDANDKRSRALTLLHRGLGVKGYPMSLPPPGYTEPDGTF